MSSSQQLITSIVNGSTKQINDILNQGHYFTLENFKAAFLLMCEKERNNPRCKYSPGPKESDWPSIEAAFRIMLKEGVESKNIGSKTDDQIFEVLCFLHHAHSGKRMHELTPYLNR